MGGTLIDRYRAARRDPKRTVLEGFHALKHALRFGAEVVEVAVADPRRLDGLCADLAPDVAERLRVLARPVDEPTFAVLSPTRIHTGVIGIAERPRVDVAAAFAASGAAPIVFLESARSPFNVGASVRVAAAAGAAGLFVSGTVDPWQPAALRAAAGLAWALPTAHVDRLPVSDRPLIAVDPAGEHEPADLPPRAILAFGTERHGLSSDLRANALAHVRIPMRDGVSSLNLATAVAAILYARRG